MTIESTIGYVSKQHNGTVYIKQRPALSGVSLSRCRNDLSYNNILAFQIGYSLPYDTESSRYVQEYLSKDMDV